MWLFFGISAIIFTGFNLICPFKSKNEKWFRFGAISFTALTAAASVSREHTPCVQSAKDTTPALRRLDRNGCGCATAPARQTSTHWPTSPPWRLRWPPFCTALTPTAHPNHSGEALKVCSHTAFFARISIGLAFYALFLFVG